MSNIRTQIGKVIGKSLNGYHSRVKPKIDELKFKEEYQGRIIDCMVGEVDDNYMETPETDENIVKLEHSKEGVIKIPQIKGKTILVDADGNETDTPAEGCRLVSVGEEEDNKLIILSKNKNLFPYTNISINAKENQTWYSLEGKQGMYGSNMWSKTNTWIYVPRGYIKVTTQELFNCVIQMITPNEEIISYNGNSLFEGGYVTFRLRNNDTVNKFGYKNLMFEWSQSPILNNSSYIEPKQHKTEILLKEPLREGDYIEGKKIYRNVKQDGLTLIPLEEPIIEELPNSITLQSFDDTTMYIENTITPTVSYGYNALIPYKQELLNQKEEVETNTLDIEQNIIPYLMDMEFNLMLMEDE